MVSGVTGRGVVESTEFPGQFVLCAEAAEWKAGWRQYRCGSFVLQSDPSLPVRPVLDQDEVELGLALGWPLDHQAEDLSAPYLRLPVRAAVDGIDRVEEAIYRLGGRYVFLLPGAGLNRVYLDPGATLGLVFSAARRMAASTTSVLALHDQSHPVWTTPRGVFPDDRPNQFYPAGLTIDPDVRRLLPGHYLDLDTWSPVRHYPKGLLEPVPPDAARACAQQIADVVRRNIHAVLRQAHLTYLPLTAGRDSRMLLACSKGLGDAIEYVTFDYSSSGDRGTALVDLEISRRLASTFALRHTVVPVQPESPTEVALEYLRHIGYSGGAGKARDFFFACQNSLDTTAAWLTGFGGEVGRGFYWRRRDQSSGGLSPLTLLERMGLPEREPFVHALREWMEGLPAGLSPRAVLDLAYLEHRVGCWASPHLYGAAPFSLNVAPFCHRAVFDLMLRRPADYKKEDGLVKDLISSSWPELLRLPFNSYDGFKGVRTRVRRRARRSMRSAGKRLGLA